MSSVLFCFSDADKIFASVFTASTKDLDWEVKKTALSFWQCTINKHLLDHKVPCNQTVVQLQNSLIGTQESISRIITVLETLGEIGCLKVSFTEWFVYLIKHMHN